MTSPPAPAAAGAATHAVVTGGGRGIGRAVAAALSAAGMTVTVVGRSARSLEAAVAAGGAHRAIVADVTDEAATAAAMREAGAGAPVDVLVANAGGAETAPFARSDGALFARMLDLNLMGAVNAIRPVLPGMLERGRGRVVVVASTAGLKGYAYCAAYGAAKHAVVGLVRALAAEHPRGGVTFNAVCPGFADTDLAREGVERIVARTGRDAEAARAELARHNPQGRLIAPEEVAAMVLYLCGPLAAGVTGQALSLSGGEV